MKNKGITIFIILVLVIIAGFFFFNVFLKNNVIEPEDTQEVVEEEIVPLVDAPEQAGGNNVFISRAVLVDGGYVVIHREEDGGVGEVIGVSEFIPAGMKENFLIDLTEEIVEGDVLFAMLHTDDGDGVFALDDDLPTVDADGNIVMTSFIIVSEGALENEFKL